MAGEKERIRLQMSKLHPVGMEALSAFDKDRTSTMQRPVTATWLPIRLDMWAPRHEFPIPRGHVDDRLLLRPDHPHELLELDHSMPPDEGGVPSVAL